MKKYFFAVVLFFLLPDAEAQFTRYIVRLKDKSATTFSLNTATAFLSQKALDRRTRYNIGIDSSDLPVPASYVTQLQNIPNVTVLNSSRWLNAVAISTTDATAITTINALPFVQSTTGLAARKNSAKIKDNNETAIIPVLSGNKAQDIAADYFDYGTSSFNEIHLHNGEFLHNIGLRGQGMQIAMLDGGFFNYTTLKAFDSVNTNGQVLSTWDFVAGNTSVVEDNSHGMQCFSTIAGNIPGQFVGKAPQAFFHLFRTEDVSSEYPIEEFNWVCAAERTDSTGADVISSSVGYYDFDNNSFNYAYADMNGDKTIAAIGADMAAKKGILIFNAAGNEGNKAWKYIVTPADGDSVVAVGSVNAAGTTVASSSSYGPSADGRIKPDMASVGVGALVQGPSNTIIANNGTSFACPNMAGLGTCLWQGFPEVNNMRIVRALKEAATIFSTPDDRIGYGIPDVKKAFSKLLIDFSTASLSATNCNATLNWTSKDVAAMKYEIERKGPADVNFIKIAEQTPAAGNILATHTYQFTNSLANFAAGTVSYRIRQIIDTSTAGFTAIYTDTTNVTISSCTTTSINDPQQNVTFLLVAPNPSDGNTSLIIETTTAIAKLQIVLFDMKGAKVMQLQKSKAAGRSAVSIPAYQLSKGKYIVQVFDQQTLIGSTDLLKQ
jgi:serine protease AprX